MISLFSMLCAVINIPLDVSDELLEGGHRAQKPSSVPPVRLRGCKTKSQNVLRPRATRSSTQWSSRSATLGSSRGAAGAWHDARRSW